MTDVAGPASRRGIGRRGCGSQCGLALSACARQLFAGALRVISGWIVDGRTAGGLPYGSSNDPMSHAPPRQPTAGTGKREPHCHTTPVEKQVIPEQRLARTPDQATRGSGREVVEVRHARSASRTSVAGARCGEPGSGGKPGVFIMLPLPCALTLAADERSRS